MEKGTQPARALWPLSQGLGGTLPACLRNRQYRIELSPGSGAAHAVSSKSVQILPEHTFSRKITQIRGAIDKKRQKEAFVGVR